MQSVLRFVRRSAEFLAAEKISQLRNSLRGIYVLYQLNDSGGKEHYEVKYIGMSRGDRLGIKGRLRSHKRSKRKAESWTHFSVFQVWDNVTKEEIEELEGLARHLYRRDSTANTMNIQRGYKKLRSVRKDELSEWD
ncbi:MAG: hypothetical protein K2W78_11100 [Xanthobacteraceae bacterium]|nr:hypothetical protein [Xanthobacteraceae bacterium]